ncbi:DUF4806 domain-containing protein [Aphis craccivora]|uniref:DUF4806 domain-containing protein n=1 Tax=Aphis craccivora TaxID=307492 RepID=A0A6G0WPR4_APHCR|nr:DUF4806 domain-containing protein [Aphis craccivora]
MQKIVKSIRPQSIIQKATKTTSKRNLFNKFIDFVYAEVYINDNLIDSENKLSTPTLIRQVITPTSSGVNRDDDEFQGNDILSGNIEETSFSLLDCPDKDLDYNNMFLSDPYNCILPEKTYTINQSQMIGVTSEDNQIGVNLEHFNENFENNDILCSNDYHNVDNDVDIFSSVDDIEKDPNYTLERNTSAEVEMETTRVEHEMDSQEKIRSRQSRGLKSGNTDTRHKRLERKKMLGYHTQQKVVKLYNKKKEIFKNYWNIQNRDRRLDFLSSLIEVLPKQTSRKRKPESHKQRKVTPFYFLMVNGLQVSVYKKCFQKTFAETNKAIEQTLKNKYTNNSMRLIELDKRGKGRPKNTITAETKEIVRSHLL